MIRWISSTCLSRLSGGYFLRKTLLVSVLAVTGLFSGVVPTLERNFTPVLNFSSLAFAQTPPPEITNTEILNYARSVLAIEPIRQVAYDEIKRILGSRQVPPIACHRRQRLNNLDGSIRQIAITYCNRAIQIVESNNLTINRFNVITVQMHDDSALASQIREQLLQLQQPSSP